MNIVCATDDNFVQHCSIMLTSLLVNNSDVQIYVLTEGLEPENEKIIREEVEDKGGKVDFCIVDSSIVEKFPMPEGAGLQHISRATYYRLLIPEILPQEVDRAIYLDCDIIINGSLDKLWNMELDGYALAAAPQIGSGFEAVRLGYPIEYGYFNAGVNLINMKYWRDNSVPKALIDFLSANYSKIKYHDQDALNAVLFDKTLHLLPMWNMTSLVYSYYWDKKGDKKDGAIVNRYEEEKRNAKAYLSNPIVLHFVSKPKPWQMGCVHPLSHLYYGYAKQTLFFNSIQQEPVVKRKLNIARYWFQSQLSMVKQFFIHTDQSRL